MYQKVSTDLNFVDREKNVGEFWRNQKIFEKSMKHVKEIQPTRFMMDAYRKW
jgi:isoleucyl-tRNA synthetase